MEGKFEIILWLELAHVKKQIREFFRLLSLQLDIQNKVTTLESIISFYLYETGSNNQTIQ